MNLKVNIEIEGSQAEVEQWLGRFGLRGGGQAVAEAVDGEDLWTPALADRLVRRITDDARAALRFLMENAPDVSWDDLQEELGITGIQMGGVMASFGFAENAGIPRPYVVNRRERRYAIDPSIAPILLEAIDRFQE